jgi:hypothetical protein
MAEDALQKKWIAWDLMLRRERGIDRVERGFVRGAEFGKRQHAREDHASAFILIPRVKRSPESRIGGGVR